MNITVVTTWFPSTRTPSSGSFVARDCDAIRGAGGTVRIVHLVAPADDDGTRKLTWDGMPVVRIPMRPSDPLSVLHASRELRRAIRGTDIVHSAAMSSLFPLVVMKKTGKLHVPWVHTEHWSGLTNVETLSPLLNIARRPVLYSEKQPNIVTAVCQYLAAPIREVRKERPTVVVPCIVEPHETVSERSHEDSTIAMVTVGGLIERKDPLFCLDILEALLDRGQDATMTFVGDGPLKPAIEGRVANHGRLRDRVHLLGTLDASGVTQALNESDIFIGPTHGDNFFVSAAEAIVAGRPVVASDRGGQTEYVNDANGTIVPLGSTSGQWADAVTETLDRLSTSSAQSIADTIGDSFSRKTVGVAYMDVYRQAQENYHRP